MSSTENTISDFIDGLLERVNDPFLFSFSFSFVLFHFDSFIYLFKSTDNADVSIDRYHEILGYSNDSPLLSAVTDVFGLPFLFAACFTIGWPWLDGGFKVLRMLARNWLERQTEQRIKDSFVPFEKASATVAELDVSKKAVINLNAELFESKQRLEEQAINARNMEHEYESERREVHVYKMDLADANKLRNKHEESINTLQSLSETSQKQLEAKNSQLQDLEQKVGFLEEEVTAYEQVGKNLSQAKSELEKKNNENINLELRVDKLERANELAEKTGSEREIELDKARLEVNTLLKERINERDLLKNATNSVRKLSGLIDSIKMELLDVEVANIDDESRKAFYKAIGEIEAFESKHSDFPPSI